MSTSLFRAAPAVRSALKAATASKAAGVASTSFVRGKATLPDLPCMYFLGIASITGYRK
jgi:Fe-Mn family superoxide dismutase